MMPGAALLLRALLLFAGLSVVAWKTVRRRCERRRPPRDLAYFKLRAAGLYLRGKCDAKVRRTLVEEGLSPTIADRLTA